MPSIILENCSNDNWFDKDWVKAKVSERQKRNLMLMEEYFSRATPKQLAAKMEISTGYYYQLKQKHGL